MRLRSSLALMFNVLLGLGTFVLSSLLIWDVLYLLLLSSIIPCISLFYDKIVVLIMKKYQLGEFEEIVLLTVGILHGNAYGVTIKDEIEARLQREVSIGSLQITLRRLESKGLLKSHHGETSESRRGRPKLYFEITAYGRKAIEYVRTSRNDLWKAMPKLVLK
jgi:PadR family transcriptional regulator PadR